MQVLIDHTKLPGPAAVELCSDIQEHTGPVEAIAFEEAGFGTQTAIAVKWTNGLQFGITFNNGDVLGDQLDIIIKWYKGEIN